MTDIIAAIIMIETKGSIMEIIMIITIRMSMVNAVSITDR